MESCILWYNGLAGSKEAVETAEADDSAADTPDVGDMLAE